MSETTVNESVVQNLNAGLKLLINSQDVTETLIKQIKEAPNNTIFNTSEELDSYVSKLTGEVRLICQHIKNCKDKLDVIANEKLRTVKSDNANSYSDNQASISFNSLSINDNQQSSGGDRVCSNYLKKGFCTEQNCSLSHCYLPVKPKTNILEEDEDQMEIYDPSEDYRPTDESRICKFFITDGKCWKRTCTYEHVETFKWTHDVIEICGGAYNSIVLPSVGTSITLTVTGIESPVTLYGHLPKEYSDIGENIDHFETLADLEGDMNHIKAVSRYCALPIDPAQGETVLAKVDKKWFRATVTSCDGPDVMVFLVDYGIKVRINVSSLRVMIPRFMHLPFQAVSCRIAGIGYKTDSPLPMSELNAIAISYLSELVLNQKISAQVKYVDHDDECIHISATVNGQDLSSILIEEGFCSTF